MNLSANIRQVLGMARAEKLYTALYLTGVTLSVATVMVLSIILYSRLAPVYPEHNRPHTLYVNSIRVMGQWGYSYSALNMPQVERLVRPLKGIERMSLVSSGTNDVNVPGKKIPLKVQTVATDPEFFSIYPFEVLHGRLLNADDLDQRLHVAVITDRLAGMVFGSAEAAVDGTLTMGYEDYKVVGVVRGAGVTTPHTYLEVFYPYSVIEDYNSVQRSMYEVRLLTEPDADVDAIRSELRRLADISPLEDITYNAADSVCFDSQPLTHYQETFGIVTAADGSSEDNSVGGMMGYYVAIAIVLLLVPAMNLSSLILGRMDRRNAEMGIRKSFGAGSGVLLRQVVVENLALTLAGSIAGLVIAWIVIYSNSSWIFTVIDEYVPEYTFAGKSPVDVSAVFSPWIFIITLAATVLLNLLSSLIPAWLSLRQPIVESLNEKK